MSQKLSKEKIVTLTVLKPLGQSNVQIARTLGVAEGTVRYHLRREASGAEDGRRGKASKADEVAGYIEAWMQAHRGLGVAASTRPVNVQALYGWLVAEANYGGSYKSVLRFVRSKYPKPRLRPFRRVETPPGAQAQVDWGEFQGVDLGDGPQKLYAFFLVLSHSRYEAVIWSRRMDQLSWHQVHNEAFRRLGGIPAVVRLDNLKTGVIRGAGPWGEINASYRSYARAVGFHVDPCLPEAPEDKGKVERRVGVGRGCIDPRGRWYDGLAGLQSWTDERLAISARQRVCPATGRSVEASWLAREKLLQLGLTHAAEALNEELSESVKHNRTAHQLLDRLLSLEVRQREERRIKTSLRLSNLPPGMTLGNFDFAFQPSVDKRQIETLATCAFIREHTSLLVQGAPGVGKTHLCVALGVKAIEHGFSVGFYLLDELLHEMRKDADVAPQRLRRKKYFNVAYLVVDEVGFEPMNHQDASHPRGDGCSEVRGSLARSPPDRCRRRAPRGPACGGGPHRSQARGQPREIGAEVPRQDGGFM